MGMEFKRQKTIVYVEMKDCSAITMIHFILKQHQIIFFKYHFTTKGTVNLHSSKFEIQPLIKYTFTTK